MQREEILHIFPDFMRPRWEKVAERADRLQEIRLRVNQPVTVLMNNRERFLSVRGELTDDISHAVCSDEKELEAVLTHLCHYSIYAFADEIRQGFMTIRGGHRIGLSGQVILEEQERIRNIKYIRYLNIRIAHEVKGVSDKALPYLYRQGEVLNTLIISPPGCGKTTMLRDLVRNFSGGNAYGKNLQKALEEGAIDELGSTEDVEAMHRAIQCGCKMLATIHGFSLEEVGRKSYMKEVMEERLFDRYLLLGKQNNRCIVTGIYDKERKLCSNLQESCY